MQQICNKKATLLITGFSAFGKVYLKLTLHKRRIRRFLFLLMRLSLKNFPKK